MARFKWKNVAQKSYPAVLKESPPVSTVSPNTHVLPQLRRDSYVGQRFDKGFTLEVSHKELEARKKQAKENNKPKSTCHPSSAEACRAQGSENGGRRAVTNRPGRKKIAGVA